MSNVTSTRRRLPRFSDRLPLGESGLSVSPFCLGRVQSAKTIPAAFDAGINIFFLSTDMHWPLYEASRRGMEMLLARGGDVREQIVVAGVAYPTQPEFCTAPFKELVQAVAGLKTLDLLIAGGAYQHEFLERLGEYEEHRRSRFVGCRAIGASFHDRQGARMAIEHDLLDIAFVRYNPVHPGARKDLFPYAPQPRRTLLFNFTNTWGYVPPERFAELGLDQDDYWQPEITDYYRFALMRPELDGLLVAPGTPREVEALAQALERGPLEDDEEQHMIDLASVDLGVARVVQPSDLTDEVGVTPCPQ